MRVWLVQKKAGNDLRKHYFLIFQTSLAVVIGIFLIAFNINMAGSSTQNDDKNIADKEQETIDVKEVVRTKQQNKPPQPPSPQTPVEVPNDEIVDADAQQQLDQIDQQLSSGKKMSLPPEPKASESEEKVFKIVEQQPKLIGGLDSLRKLIDYPNMAEKAGIEGRVYIQFVVNKKGNVEDPKVIRGPGAGLNKEALRVIKKAEFRPGIQAGHPVNVRYTMPITFQIGQYSQS